MSTDIVTAYTGRRPTRPKDPSSSCGRYDDRFDLGRTLAWIGGAIWLIAVVVYFAVSNGGDDNSFDEATNSWAGFFWGGAISAFGCFVMLCGVIFMAGAERIDR